MANQAMGVYSKTHLIPETDLKTFSSDLQGKILEMPFNSNSVASSQKTTAPSTMTGRRDTTEPILGNVDVQGSIALPLDTRACGYMLAMTFGAPTTTAVEGKEGLYKHVFKPSTVQPSFAVEKAFNNNIYALSKGCKVSKISFSFGGDGELTMNTDVIGCDETFGEAGVATTATPATPVGLNRLNNFNASLKIDGEDTAIATQVTLDVDFGLDSNGYAIGSNGFRTRINEGLIAPTGKLTAFFDDASFVDKAMKSTTTALEIALVKGDESMTIDIPEVKFARKTPSIDGATGITQELDYSAFYGNNALGTCIQFTLVNNVASYDIFK